MTRSDEESADVKLRNYYINYKELCGSFFDLGANLLFFNEEPLLIEQEMKKPAAARLLSDLVDEERRRFLEHELKEIKEEEENQVQQKFLEKGSIDWLLRYYLAYTMNEFYLKMEPFRVDENPEYHKMLLSLCEFRKKVTDFFADFKNQTLIQRIGNRNDQNEERLSIISIAEGLVLHSENQYLRVSNQYLEIVGSGPELVWVKSRRTEADTSGTNIMRWIWQREVLLVAREFSQERVFKELPFEEHDIELKLNRFLRSKTKKTPIQNIVMSKMANDFFSVGMHNVMEEVITSFEEWDAKEFERSWMKTWGYNFREGKSIEKESVETLEEMRKKVLSYDPLLLIVADQESKKDKKVRDERLIEFVEVQLLLTKICHLPVQARRWKDMLSQLGIKELEHIELFIRFESTEQELNKSFIGQPHGKRLLLARIYLWFAKNRKGNSLKHLLMLDANMFEGQIRGHAFTEEDSDVLSLWGEKIIIELKPFSKENGHQVKDSYLYIFSGNHASELWGNELAGLNLHSIRKKMVNQATLMWNTIMADCSKRLKQFQDKAFLYRMPRNSQKIGRDLKYTELECLTVERMSKMDDLNHVYRNLMTSRKFERELNTFVDKIVTRFWKNSTYLLKQSQTLVLKNINFNLESYHRDNLGECILVQETNEDMDNFYMVHGDEWGDNFLIDENEVIPIDYEDVVYVEKGKYQFFTGGGILAQRFINEKVMPDGFESDNYASMNTIASLGRLIAALIQFRCRNDRSDIPEDEIPGSALLRSLNRGVAERISRDGKEKLVNNQLLKQLNLSIIDWLAHWVNKRNGKMPQEDFKSVRDHIVNNYLPNLKDSTATLEPISISQ